MTLPIPLAERVTTLERRADRHDGTIDLIRAGMDLISEDIIGLRGTIGEFREEVAESFTAVNVRLDGHDARFDQIDARLDSHDARFDQIDARLDGHDARFDQIDVRLDRIDGRLDRQDLVLTAIAGHFGIEVPPGD